MTEITRPVLRYHGARRNLPPWIQQFFPPHMVYVEPFGGGASVLLRKPRAHGEVYNDLSGDIVNLFRVLQQEDSAARLAQLLVVTPYAREEFHLAYEPTDDPIERARRTLIRAEMGFGSAGATKRSTGFRIDTVRNYGTAMSVWARVPEKIMGFVQRLQGVLIENHDALKVIAAHDTPRTLFYVDPPYVHATREVHAARGRYYEHEMTDADHERLLEVLRGVDGMVVLSGYPCALYDDALAGWQRHETEARIAAARGTKIKTEVVWLNPACSAALDATRAQGCLLAEVA